MVTTVLAIAGWLLFAATAILYWVGNRQNGRESNSLAVYSLALLFSDEFRDGIRAGIGKAANEGRAQGFAPEILMYRLMQGVTNNALAHYKPDAEVSTISIVVDVLHHGA